MRIDLASHKSLEQVRAFLERGPGGGRQRAAAAGAGGAVRAHPAEPGAVRLQDAAAGRAGAGAGVSAADDGTVAIAGDQAGGAQPAGGAIAGPAAAGAAVRQQVHAGGHRGAGGTGRGAREAVGASYAQAVPAGLGAVRGRALRAPGGHLERACLQPAQDGRLPAPAGQRGADAPAAGGDRGAAPGLRAGGHGAPGRPRRGQGGLPHQRGGRGDAVPGGRLGGDDQRAAPAAGAGATVGGVPLCHPGLSLRQRLGVCQPPRGQAAGEAAGGVHQVTAAAQHRQCTVRGQERLGGAQAPGLRAHSGALRGAPVLNFTLFR